MTAKRQILTREYNLPASWWRWALGIFFIVMVFQAGGPSDLVAPKAQPLEPKVAGWRPVVNMGGGGMWHGILVEPGAVKAETLEDAGRVLCGRRPGCNVWAWTDPAMIPKRLPMSQAAVDSSVGARRGDGAILIGGQEVKKGRP